MKNGATPSHCVGSLQAARRAGRRGLAGNCLIGKREIGHAPATIVE